MVSPRYPINLGIQFLWDSKDKVLLNFYPDVSPNVRQGSGSSVSSHFSHPQPLPVHLSVPVGHLHRADQPTHLWPGAQTKHSGRMPPRLSRYGHQHVRSETTFNILRCGNHTVVYVILVGGVFKLAQLRGIQIRKLYEPQLFPDASMLPIFDKHFGPQTSG